MKQAKKQHEAPSNIHKTLQMSAANFWAKHDSALAWPEDPTWPHQARASALAGGWQFHHVTSSTNFFLTKCQFAILSYLNIYLQWRIIFTVSRLNFL